jgi:hypothetical protein
MFEPQTDPLLSPSRFVRRMLKFLWIGGATDGVVVGLGAMVFRATEGLGWLDAFVDAAMVVTGNGPRNPIRTVSGRLFLTLYALAGGTTYIIVAAIVLAPALHRLLHAFHVRAPEDL